MKEFLPFLFLLFWIAPNNGFGQEEYSIQPDAALAHHLFDKQNYDGALKEYLKLYFFDREGKEIQNARYIASCFYQIGNTKEAIKYLNIYLRQKGLSKQQQSDAYYLKVQYLLDKNETKQAIAELFQMSDEIVVMDPDKYYYYLSLLHYLSQDIASGNRNLMQLSYASKINEASLANLEKKLSKQHNKIHFFARLWSSLIPGLGQTINGEAKDGLNSAVVNGALLYYFFDTVNKSSWLDAALSVGPWLARFYVGGMSNAIRASKKKQKTKISEIIIDINQLIASANSTTTS